MKNDHSNFASLRWICACLCLYLVSFAQHLTAQTCTVVQTSGSINGTTGYTYCNGTYFYQFPSGSVNKVTIVGLTSGNVTNLYTCGGSSIGMSAPQSASWLLTKPSTDTIDSTGEPTITMYMCSGGALVTYGPVPYATSIINWTNTLSIPIPVAIANAQGDIVGMVLTSSGAVAPGGVVNLTNEPSGYSLATPILNTALVTGGYVPPGAYPTNTSEITSDTLWVAGGGTDIIGTNFIYGPIGTNTGVNWNPNPPGATVSGSNAVVTMPTSINTSATLIGASMYTNQYGASLIGSATNSPYTNFPPWTNGITQTQELANLWFMNTNGRSRWDDVHTNYIAENVAAVQYTISSDFATEGIGNISNSISLMDPTEGTETLETFDDSYVSNSGSFLTMDIPIYNPANGTTSNWILDCNLRHALLYQVLTAIVRAVIVLLYTWKFFWMMLETTKKTMESWLVTPQMIGNTDTGITLLGMGFTTRAPAAALNITFAVVLVMLGPLLLTGFISTIGSDNILNGYSYLSTMCHTPMGVMATVVNSAAVPVPVRPFCFWAFLCIADIIPVVFFCTLIIEFAIWRMANFWLLNMVGWAIRALFY